MAKLIRCKQGHVFDAEKRAACPVCGEEVDLTPSNTDDSNGQDLAPPPPPTRTSRRLIIVGTTAILAVAAVAGGYFVFRTDVRPPEKPIASASSTPSTAMPTAAPETPSPVPATASPPSSTSGGETKPAPTEASVAKQTPAPTPGSTDADNANAKHEEKPALANSAPAPTLPPLANVDPAIVGEWDLAANSGRWVMRIEPDGAYAFHAEPLDAAKPDSGVFAAEAGQWAMRTNNGFRDGGSYSVTSAGTFVAKGHRGTTTWHRVVGVPQSILGQVDPRTVGHWELPVALGRWLWRIKADGTFEFHSEANDGMKPGAGTLWSMDGRWSLRSPNGYTDGGPYSFPTPDTFLATGHFGTGAWRRIP
jgi:hypothetical protein